LFSLAPISCTVPIDYEFQFPRFDFTQEPLFYMTEEPLRAPPIDASYFQFEYEKAAAAQPITTEHYEQMKDAHKKMQAEEGASRKVAPVRSRSLCLFVFVCFCLALLMQ
jgi:hypothetical protein